MVLSYGIPTKACVSNLRLIISHTYQFNWQSAVTTGDSRTAVVVTLNFFVSYLPFLHQANHLTFALKFRMAGGTTGLAHLSTVLNCFVCSHLKSLVAAGRMTQSQVDHVMSDGGYLDSLYNISDLSPEVLSSLRDTYRSGVRWALFSLIPWSCILLLVVMGLYKPGLEKSRDNARNPDDVQLQGLAEPPPPRSSRMRRLWDSHARSRACQNEPL